MKPIIVFVVCAMSILGGCARNESQQSLTQTDRIQLGTYQANSQDAGNPGIPVDLASITSSKDGSFVAALSGPVKLCTYTLRGRIEGDGLSFERTLLKECAGGIATTVAGVNRPRNLRLNPESCSGGSAVPLNCFVAIDRANRELVIALDV